MSVTIAKARAMWGVTEEDVEDKTEPVLMRLGTSTVHPVVLRCCVWFWHLCLRGSGTRQDVEGKYPSSQQDLTHLGDLDMKRTELKGQPRGRKSWVA